MRYRPRLDGNQQEIVDKLRDEFGCSVQSLAGIGCGCPDLLIGSRGVNTCIELKDGSRKPSEQQLSYEEKIWHLGWQGQVAVAHSLDEVLEVLEFLKVSRISAERSSR